MESGLIKGAQPLHGPYSLPGEPAGQPETYASLAGAISNWISRDSQKAMSWLSTLAEGPWDSRFGDNRTEFFLYVAVQDLPTKYPPKRAHRLVEMIPEQSERDQLVKQLIEVGATIYGKEESVDWLLGGASSVEERQDTKSMGISPSARKEIEEWVLGRREHLTEKEAEALNDPFE